MRNDLSLHFGNRSSEKCHLFFKSTVQNEQYYPINTTYMSTFSFSSYKSEEVLLDETTTIDQQELIVYNDDHNTFEWVINCFVDVLRRATFLHDPFYWKSIGQDRLLYYAKAF